MRLKYIKLIILFCSSLGLLNLQAQEANTTTGGEASGSGGSSSYSVGQVVYTSHTGTNGNSIAQGVQQAYEISEVTAVENAKGINLSISAYPNPTADYLTLKIENFEISNLQYQLFDLQGKLLKTKIITDKETQIDMSNYVSATYFVKLISQNQQIKNFKIIKN